MAEDAERTEAPSQRRRDETRRKGQVAVSSDVAPVAVLMMSTIVAGWGVPLLVERTGIMFRAWLAAIGPMAAHDDPVGPLAARAALQVVTVLGPFLVAMGAVGASAVIAQIGFTATPSLVAPKWSRVSPLTGWQRIASSQGLMTIGKSLAKIALLGTVGWRVLSGMMEQVITTPLIPLPALMGVVGGALDHLLWCLLSTLAVLAAGDFIWQRYHHEQQLRMTRQEVKDESKQSEGDPGVKARFRRAARELGKRRMLTEVARADVVIANPTHFAVALRYRAAEGAAPRVVAKGAGELALKIKEAARGAGVPIVERRSLARALYRSVEIGQEVPPAVYRAVAEILSYIYSLRQRPATEAR
jgi:flagellar biosynthesis protein FlhB